MSHTVRAWRGIWRMTPTRAGAAVGVLFIVAALLDGVSVSLVLSFLSVIGGGDASDSSVHRILDLLTSAFVSIGVPFTLRPLLVFIGAAVLLRTVAQFAGAMLLARVKEQLLVRMRVQLVANLFGVAPRYHLFTQAGDLAQAALDDVEKTGFALDFMFKLLSLGAMLTVWVGVMLLFSWRLTLLSMAIAAVLTVLVRLRVAYSARFGERLVERKRCLSAALVELLSGLRVIWLSTTESREIDRVRGYASDVAAATYQFARNSALVKVAGENFANVALLAIVYVSVERLRVDLATLVGFFFLLSRVLPQSHRLNVIRTDLAGYLAHAANVLHLLSREDKPYVTDGSVEIAAIERDVVLDAVWFEYRPGEPVLRGVSFRLRRGEMIALAGASGAGKSTIVDLLARFQDPMRGEIRIDGRPLRELKIAAWRRRLGIVSQEVFLFDDTIRNNIAYGCDELSATQVEEVARMANAHGFISELPHGYETRVGVRGLTLSGGQRQRIALARALARRPDLLILDEATNSVDAESERLIFDVLDLSRGPGRPAARRLAILVIGHRLASLRKADRIHMIEGGEIVESGTHAELMASAGRYAQFCELQHVSTGDPVSSPVGGQSGGELALQAKIAL